MPIRFETTMRSTLVLTLLLILLCGSLASGQSGKSAPGGGRTVTLNVIVRAPEGRLVTREDFDLYDSGISQEIESFAKLDTGSRIVLLVDNSASLKIEAPALTKMIEAIVNELFQDDQMMVVGYNEAAEIVEDMTADLAKLQGTAGKMLRKGSPNLFDAVVATADAIASQASLGIEKRAIILISDGYDSESKSKFEDAIRSLQEANVVLYALQAVDRTRGALLRDKPKPPAALQQLTGATGGAIFPGDRAEDAARQIADDLRKNWYRLVYTPSGISIVSARRLLIMSHDPKIEVRTKNAHPSRYRASG
jgi:VWFA-related protein